MKKYLLLLFILLSLECAVFGAAVAKAKVSNPITQVAQNKINYQRKKAVAEAWKQERKLVESTGQGTREWTRIEKKELLMKGKVQGYQGHHINSVKNHPEMAGDPNNIKFVRASGEHLAEHNGNYRNPTSGKLINRGIK